MCGVYGFGRFREDNLGRAADANIRKGNVFAEKQWKPPRNNRVVSFVNTSLQRDLKVDSDPWKSEHGRFWSLLQRDFALG
jgi:hypothetical protein